MNNVLPFHRKHPPLWASVAGVFIGSALFGTIVLTMLLAAAAQAIAEQFEDVP